MAQKPFTFEQGAQYLADLLKMRGSGLPAGRVQRMTQCVNLLRSAGDMRAQLDEIERVVHFANYCDDESMDAGVVAIVREIAAEAGRPVDTPQVA